jgi:hypothetical protein
VKYQCREAISYQLRLAVARHDSSGERGGSAISRRPNASPRENADGETHPEG